MKQRCTNAIKQVGSWFLTEEKQSFFASLHPKFQIDGDISNSGGYATIRPFEMFFCHDEVSSRLKAGMIVANKNRRYVIRRIEEITFKGEPAYLKGIVHLIREDNHE